MTEDVQFESPSAWLLAMEARLVGEFAALIAATPLLRGAPRGDGHTVLVVPGFGTSDRGTAPLRWTLRRLGYEVEGWSDLPNRGSTPEAFEQAKQRLAMLCAMRGKVSLVGHSLGGIFGRELARATPASIRQVITVGSPFRFRRGDRSNARAIAKLFVDPKARHPHVVEPREELRAPLTVPSTAIYSRSDGVVNWRSCIDASGPRRENIEVRGSHSGLLVNPAVLLAIADRLAVPESRWEPYRPPLALRRLYPRPETWLPGAPRERRGDP